MEGSTVVASRKHLAMGFGNQLQRICRVTPGPTGCGKSTALQILAKELGFTVCEWQPPVPTLWHEQRYQVLVCMPPLP